MITAGRPLLSDLVDSLDLAERVALLTGADHWHTRAAPSIGLRPVLFSDGPAGVRGPVWDERHPSLSLPAGSVLASTWDQDLARRYGSVLAAEARRRGVHAVLGPTVNLHRTAYSGRNFESFSEDPALTGAIAAALVEGMQSLGIAAVVKHFVANDYETERFTASSVVSERTLREVYLAPFEACVAAGAWAVMSAYNRVNGTPAGEHPLLSEVLKEDWKFDGLVISDWGGVRSLRAARSGQDLVMPGPAGPWGDALLRAIEEGELPADLGDDKVLRLLRLARRCGALGSRASVEPSAPSVEDGIRTAREVAADGMVLLVNRRNVLPLDGAALGRIAVIGQCAAQPRVQGGGSATVMPDRIVSPVDALREALPEGTTVTWSLGALAHDGVAGIPPDELVHPTSGEPGVLVTFHDAAGNRLFSEDRLSTDLVWFGGEAPAAIADHLVIEFGWVPRSSGRIGFGFAAAAHGIVEVDGDPILTATGRSADQSRGASPLRPPSITVPMEVDADRRYHVRVRLAPVPGGRGQAGLLACRVGTAVTADPDQLVAEAVDAAASADVAVVVVGTGPESESEGFDRVSLSLPGHQNTLVAQVAATGTPTVVVLNTGAPVLTPWRERAAAVLHTGFAGQEMGAALSDVLLGSREPGGRLPTTWPDEDQPAPGVAAAPIDGELDYAEGVHLGHRAWLRADRSPAFWFGHGLGYTTWTLERMEIEDPDGDDVHVRVHITNNGERTGKQVVQVFLSRPDSTVERPVRWLAGHAVVRLGPHEAGTVDVVVPRRAMMHWDGGWQTEPGTFQVLAGTSAQNLPLRGVITS